MTVEWHATELPDWNWTGNVCDMFQPLGYENTKHKIVMQQNIKHWNMMNILLELQYFKLSQFNFFQH